VLPFFLFLSLHGMLNVMGTDMNVHRYADQDLSLGKGTVSGKTLSLAEPGEDRSISNCGRLSQ
jgi:hypothetical protein